MHIGVPKEIKAGESRVGLVPASVRELVAHNHKVSVEISAGMGSGFSDEDYRKAGAEILTSAEQLFAQAELIVKVKEPQAVEIALLREDHILFTYLHLAADLELTKKLADAGCTAIAYETVTDNQGRLPLLVPMSEVAGRLSVQAGSYFLQKQNGGKGVLLGGVPGVRQGNVVVIGAGVVGTNALRMALGRDAHVTVLDRSLSRLQDLDQQYGGRLNTVFSTQDMVEEFVLQADLVIGAVLIPGHKAPRLVTKAMLQSMQSGSVLVDVAIDQGGCFETSHPTSFDDPVFNELGILHYCVTNMPGAVPRTSSFALNNATLPFVLEIANKGYIQALRDDGHLCNGLNLHAGNVTYEAVASDHELNYVAPAESLRF